MMKIAIALLSLLAVVSFAGTTAIGATPPPEVTIPMHAQNGSGEDGSAILTQEGGDVKVVISLKGAPSADQPAHIHDGTCADLKAVAYPLTSVTSGSSTTMIRSASLAKWLKGGGFSINVHESAADLGKYVSCGEITAPSSM
jgi:hypothetical protein